MKKLHRLIIGLSLTAAAILSAQTAPTDGPRGPRRGGPGGPGGGPGPGPHGRGPGQAIVRVIDADKDGVLSAVEIANASARIRALDKNGDGTVSFDEMHPARPEGAPTPPAGAPPRDGERPDRPIVPVMLALDANNDGALSATEINNATNSLKALDANGDGNLTLDELRPLPPVRE